MKVIAFGASTSSTSINKQLAQYAASLLKQCEVEVLDLNDFELPLFSEDKEKEIGQPHAAQAFMNKINACDGVIISFAEHNGSYTAAYKNLFDWCSRINYKMFTGKSALLLATSPGARGGQGVLKLASESMPRFGAQIKAQLSVPSFYDNFDSESGQLKDTDLNTALVEAVAAFQAS